MLQLMGLLNPLLNVFSCLYCLLIPTSYQYLTCSPSQLSCPIP
uniref:Uncharacterized protein n=1 Tax=Cryptosporidium parvum TaxID=5807 RepID=F0X594_CRYPV